MTSIAKLQNDLNALILQETKANTEKQLVLSMLCQSYTQRLNDIGYGYHNLIGFYQEAVEVINTHFKEHNLSNLLVDSEDNTTSQNLLNKARNNNGSFSQRWSYLDFENAISYHLDGSNLDSSYFQETSETKASESATAEDSNYPLFTRPFFIALKNLQS